ncbi:MAG: hypothetical protein V1808_04555 [Candidatus Daviesbacteria bacterium]
MEKERQKLISQAVQFITSGKYQISPRTERLADGFVHTVFINPVNEQEVASGIGRDVMESIQEIQLDFWYKMTEATSLPKGCSYNPRRDY